MLEQQGDLARATELMQVYVDYLRELGHPDAEKRAAELEQVRRRMVDDERRKMKDERRRKKLR